MSTRRTSPGYYAAVGILALLLIAAMGFVVAMALRPSPAPATASVSTTRTAVDCPAGTGRATCFETVVTNTGGEQGTFTCRVVALEGQTATFTDGSTALVPLDPDQNQALITAVTVKGKDEAQAPQVLCSVFS